MALIDRLPTELLSGTCTQLEPADVLALRLASRDLSAKSFDHFASRFFASLQLLVTSVNLDRLKDIASHPVLGTCVREVRITPALFEGSYDLSIDQYHLRMHWSLYYRCHSTRRATSSASSDSEEGQTRYAAYRAAVADHLGIATTPVLRRVLEHAFERFPNLQSVGLKHCNPWGATIGVGQINWTRPDIKCRGWRALAEASGCDPADAWDDRQPFPPGTPSVRSHVFSLMAMVAVRRKIDILDTCGGFCGGLILGDHQLWLTRSQWDSPPSSDEAFESVLEILITAASNLTTLQFSLRMSYRPRHFEWAAQRGQFSKLSVLSIKHVHTSPKHLEKFLLSAAPTLISLKLSLVRLSSATELGDGDTDAGGQRAWRRVWDFLWDNVSLEHAYFSFLYYGPSCNRAIVVDRLHGHRGSPPLVDRWDEALFDAELAKVSFRDWIDQMDVEPERDSDSEGESYTGFEMHD
ncbi:hypothetical protein N658DRAFT_509159 [Parathielavia hyrcaniae]|uniref:F-box domain-containing protein n=1 Tax=Parathielavia hyrcaniae TaxID=113614 RepID=A0AAN6PW60_9PEZI|nr:hypothetical protein N658DRAFT_509159 [Parathielavia hyrcaniae]